MTSPVCPRCLGDLRPPGLWSSTWQCERHGDVEPYHVASGSGEHALAALARDSRVPLWAPRPLPVGWVVSGLAWAGDERTGARATAIACTGPSPVGGPGDLVLVAEEPGVGLGARLAGLSGPDPGPPEGQPEAKIVAAGHPTALWPVRGAPPDRAASIGEAKAVWLWAVLWPASAALLLVEHLVLHDLRDGRYAEIDLVFGAPSPYLTAPPRP